MSFPGPDQMLPVPADPVLPAEAMVEEAPAGDAGKVRTLLLQWLKACVNNAKEQTKDTIQSTDMIDRVYKGARSYASIPASQAEELNYRIELREIADQIDALAGLLFEVMFPAGPPFTATAKGGELQEVVDVIRDCMMEMLESTDSYLEIEDSIMCYCKYRLGGLKIERRTRDIAECRYDEVPAESQQAFEFVLQQAQQQGFVDDFELLPSPSPQHLRYRVESTRPKTEFRLCSINPRNVLISDARRSLLQQHTVHEAHYWTKMEMEAAGFGGLDKLGAPDANHKHNPEPNHTVASGAPNLPSVDFGVYEVWESWAQVPWMQWVHEAKITLQDLEAFAAEEKIDRMAGVKASDFAPGNYWRVFHTCDHFLKVSPNFMWRRSQLPYFGASFIPPSNNEYAGQALAERQGEVYAALQVIFNHWLDNQRMRGNQSMFVAGGLQMSDAEFDKIHKPRGRVRVPGNLDPRDAIFPYDPMDLTDSALKAMSFLKGDVEDKGVNPALQGQASEPTATQSSINNSRGQVKINASFRRYVRRVLLPALKGLRDGICSTFSAEDYIRITGERGAVMKDLRWDSPEDAESRMKIEPVASFDYAERQQKANFLNMLANVHGQFLTPQQRNVIIKLTAQYARLSSSEVEELLGTEGSVTDVQEEIRSMITDPTVRVRVRPEDNHQMALFIAQQAAQNHPTIVYQPNFQEYVQAHRAALEAMMMQQMQQAQLAGPPRPPGGGAGGARGKQKQEPKGEVGGDVTQARQQGQAPSPPDQGMMTNAGMTGRAIPGRPAGI